VRVLYLWAIRHPASSYVQGINELIIPFFVVFLSTAGTGHPASSIPGHHSHAVHSITNACRAVPCAPCRVVGKEDVEELDFGTVPADVVSMVEADCYWCLSALLDDIQVRVLPAQAASRPLFPPSPLGIDPIAAVQDHYTSDQPGIQRLIFKLKELIRRIDRTPVTHSAHSTPHARYTTNGHVRPTQYRCTRTWRSRRCTSRCLPSSG